MSLPDGAASALEIAGAVASRRVSARAVAAAALDRIGKRDGALNCFTAVLSETRSPKLSGSIGRSRAAVIPALSPACPSP